MARKLCGNCNTRTVGTGPGEDDATAKAVGSCNTCYTEAGWINSHSDWGHDADSDTIVDPDSGNTDGNRVEGCWVCFPELNLTTRPAVVRTGHKNTAAHSHNPHTTCKHAKTPKDRAACRKANAYNAETGVWAAKA